MTPLEKYPALAKAIGFSELYFKREDLHPYQSHKGRSIPIMIDRGYEAGDRIFCLSSSGNAALAAALHTRKINSEKSDPVSLDIFVGPNISQNKLAKLQALTNDHIRVLIKERPQQAATQRVNEGAHNLRQSMDDEALIGYESLAAELAEIKNLGAVFIGTSSGTTAQALASYFLEKKMPMQVHIVQTSSCHPMINSFEPYSGPDERSIADAITDQVAHRRDLLVPLIKQTGGRGWYATNEEIEAAQKITLDQTKLKISTNSALSVVGVMHAAYRGLEIKGVVVCLICGE